MSSHTTTSRLNDSFIELMEKLSDIMLKQGETFRARAYQKAQETIMSYPGDIFTPSALEGKPGIGTTIMEKLKEFVETGTLKIIEREKNNPVNILAEVYGVGPKKSKELVDAGITTIEQLRQSTDLLNDVQKVGLMYYEDILTRIPRSEIDQYSSIFNNDFKKVASPNSGLEIVGSYRRGASNSGDIDVIITSDDPKIFVRFIDILIQRGVILEVLSRGPSKCLVITKIPSSNTARRVDFLWTNLDEFPFAVLYFTGSKIFNTVMRHQALQLGFTMNEHGLYHMVDKKKGEKVSHKFRSEKDIFDYLNMEYKTPQERIDGRAAVIKMPVATEKKELTVEKKELQKSIEPNKLTLKKPQRKNIKLIIEEDYDEPACENLVLGKKTTVNSDKNNSSCDKNKVGVYVKTCIEAFKKNGISILQQLNESQLSNILREANTAYYNNQPIMTDNEFDIIKQFTENKFPSSKVTKEIGASVERNKVTLPYFMGSMDKIKPDTNALLSWVNKYNGPYMLSCKLDGVSGLYTTEGSQPKLYTRGDGRVGQDISHLIPYLRLPKKNGLVIRGELIIPKSIFAVKYKNTFANPRNMVAGLINQKTVGDAIRDVQFIAYEVIKPVLKPTSQIAFLSSLNIEFVINRPVNTISNELLSKILLEWREYSIYEIDGIIVSDDKVYERKIGNPEHAFAFKMVLSDQIAEAKVVDVLWSASKDGYLKPRVQIEPISLGGVKIEFATGFNAAFIRDNKVGIGAVIELIRSGDVIPHIRKVVVPAEQAKLPVNVSYKWNDTNVDIMLEDLSSDSNVKEKVITGFFKGIGVDGLGPGNVARIIDAGFDNVPKIIKMTIDDLLTIDGFKEKTATKLYNGIRESLEEASLIDIMSASNIFGRGFSEKRLELIMESYPEVLTSNETPSQKIERVTSIKGMAAKTSEAFVEGIVPFIQFVKNAGLMKKLESALASASASASAPVNTSHPLFGKTIVITGFRDAVLQDTLKTVGAKIGASVSKNTFVVLVKDLEETTGKVADSKKLGIPIMNVDDFKNMYL